LSVSCGVSLRKAMTAILDSPDGLP
jgi:hypothetical protein